MTYSIIWVAKVESIFVYQCAITEQPQNRASLRQWRTMGRFIINQLRTFTPGYRKLSCLLLSKVITENSMQQQWTKYFRVAKYLLKIYTGKVLCTTFFFMRQKCMIKELMYYFFTIHLVIKMHSLASWTYHQSVIHKLYLVKEVNTINIYTKPFIYSPVIPHKSKSSERATIFKSELSIKSYFKC